MNVDVMFSSKTDPWSTPQDFFDELDSEFHFTLDACALPENAKCDQYFTPEQDGLKHDWVGTVWCNPPYGREIGTWVEKAYQSALGGLRLSCSCQQGLIQNGSISTYMARLKLGS